MIHRKYVKLLQGLKGCIFHDETNSRTSHGSIIEQIVAARLKLKHNPGLYEDFLGVMEVKTITVSMSKSHSSDYIKRGETPVGSFETDRGVEFHEASFCRKNRVCVYFIIKFVDGDHRKAGDGPADKEIIDIRLFELDNHYDIIKDEYETFQKVTKKNIEKYRTKNSIFVMKGGWGNMMWKGDNAILYSKSIIENNEYGSFTIRKAKRATLKRKGRKAGAKIVHEKVVAKKTLKIYDEWYYKFTEMIELGLKPIRYINTHEEMANFLDFRMYLKDDNITIQRTKKLNNFELV